MVLMIHGPDLDPNSRLVGNYLGVNLFKQDSFPNTVFAVISFRQHGFSSIYGNYLHAPQLLTKRYSFLYGAVFLVQYTVYSN